MALKDEINNAKKVFKDGTRSEKIEYLWCYYKWHLIIPLTIIIIMINIVYSNLSAKETVLQGVFLNTFADEENVEKLEQDFLKRYPIDSSTEEVLLNMSLSYDSDNTYASYGTLQIITAKAIAGEIDLLVGNKSVLEQMSYGQCFSELSNVLTKEQYERYAPYFLYRCDLFGDSLNNIDITSENDLNIDYPDSSKPKQMEKPVPIMIDVSDSEKLREIYPLSEDNLALSIMINGKNPEKTLEFIDYLME